MIRNGDSLGPSLCLWLGLVLTLRGEAAVGGGWIARAHGCSRASPRMSSNVGTYYPRVYQHLGRGDCCQG